jgi:hypothetical protein
MTWKILLNVSTSDLTYWNQSVMAMEVMLKLQWFPNLRMGDFHLGWDSSRGM